MRISHLGIDQYTAYACWFSAEGRAYARDIAQVICLSYR